MKHIQLCLALLEIPHRATYVKWLCMERNLIKLELVWMNNYGRNFHILAKKYETLYVLFNIEELSRENVG